MLTILCGKMSYSQQVAEMKNMSKMVNRKDMESLSTEREYSDFEEIQGEIANIGKFKYSHMKKERYSM